jgi:long-chain fatty acid transport protein
MLLNRKSWCALIIGSTLSGSALATNGYAPHGIGMTSKGLGGVFIGHQGDAVGLGGNPAGSAFLNDRFDIGLDLFRPIRDAEIAGNFFADGDYDGSDTKLFLIPEIGYRKGINNDIAFGLSVFGNGGMNSDYKDGIPLFNFDGTSSDRTGINLMQLFVVPNMSYKINNDHAIGVGLNLVAQGFEAEGLTNFTAPAGTPQQFSESPGDVTDNGMDWAYGAGLRLGWVGKVSPMVTLGATYQTRSYMSEFDDYKGLFAEQGDFDVPSNFGAGIAIKAMSNLLIAADVMRINYSEVDSIGNKSSEPALLGSDNGPGFGWKDMTVFKLGVEYAVKPNMTLRAGYNHGNAPIPSSQTLFNMLAPATVEDHITLGGTWDVNNSMSITGAYMHAFENEIEGSGSIAPGFGGGEANIKMYQDSLGIAFSWKM